ncbi:MAG: STAS domain-containing protein [Gammaproteobacteria bacterium]|nr:STAS domain-containing protein [Gammaproteobacteria bacterium]
MAARSSKSGSSEPRATVTRGDDGRLYISGVLDFSTVTDLLDDINRSVSGQGESSVDLAGVEHANSAGLALLAELKATAVRGGRSLVFENVPDSLSQIATVCQVRELLLDS